MEKLQKILRGANFITGNIIFDDNEIIVQRDSKAFWFSIIVILFMSAGSLLRLIDGSLNAGESFFYYDIMVLLVASIMLIFSFFNLMEIRRTSNMVFKISDLKSVLIESKKKKFVRIQLNLGDSRKTTVTVHNDIYFNDFIDTIRRQNISIVQ